jgi:hypothetical protein
MLCTTTFVHAALAACTVSLILPSASSAATLNINVPAHIVQTPGMTTTPPAGGPKHFSSPTGHPSSGNNGRDHEGGGDSAFKDSRRWGKSPGGGQPGEPWHR